MLSAIRNRFAFRSFPHVRQTDRVFPARPIEVSRKFVVLAGSELRQQLPDTLLDLGEFRNECLAGALKPRSAEISTTLILSLLRSDHLNLVYPNTGGSRRTPAYNLYCMQAFHATSGLEMPFWQFSGEK